MSERLTSQHVAWRQLACRPADLATVDTLITAGIANSRAEVLRWAVGRIREHPAYAQLQERVHEIDQLKAQF